MKIEILGLYPLNGNGGIASWSRKFISTFPDHEYSITPIDISPSMDFTHFERFDRYVFGLKALWRIVHTLRSVLGSSSKHEIMHITTSGGYGVIRDNIVARICIKNQLKCVMHCRFGSIKELYGRKGIIGAIFRNNFKLYDQIWVLDRQSSNFLCSNTKYKEKVFLTPNSIIVPDNVCIPPKQYKRVGFVGNIVISKGIMELVQAIVELQDDTELIIVGSGDKDILEKIKTLAGCDFGNRIKLMGRLPNDEAVKVIETLDIIALPTYYGGEAFPISILEAMSRGKLVISCPRAAIPDMLLAVDGSNCGVLIPEKNPEAIVEAIKWCQDNAEEADEMCRKAYEKVKTCYSKEVIYDVYRTNYRKLLNE